MFFSPINLVKRIAKIFPYGVFFKPTTEPVIALTIDDVGDDSTQEILEAIADYNQNKNKLKNPVKATFFITTHQLQQNSKILDQILAQDHELGNHGVYDRTHANLKPAELEQEILEAHQQLTQYTGAQIKWFRPGRGRYNQTMVKILSKMVENAGYYPQFALASMIPLDTYRMTNHPKFTAQYATQFIFPGSILVLHGGSPQRAHQTAMALPSILSYCEQNHYRVVSLTELFEQY